ncbi:ABC transporter substrate-binding protein [Hahella sp. CCB-MM4]|uniref:ABC transporter substrate-binding protein n=1 Tax=Hahella sp. (strain CCB-MM4) TaxID=1926491 RepID=UPI000B9A6949|nr:ABC transporter substrate binding protein [Hahella sp. CCB-MM4]OZG70715.1 ABC transporter substrate-binding protein [Hahella sp. CCB-MM4]
MSTRAIVRTIFAFMSISGMVWMGCTSAYAESAYASTPPPNVKEVVKKWRIAYYEGGDYVNYQSSLFALLSGLMELGWIEKTPIPAELDSKSLWDWVGKNAKSKFLTFPSDAFYSADWVQENREVLSAAIIHRLNYQKDIDLIFAMGTWAGQDLANDSHKTPTFVISTTDPIRSGIIKSAEDSGYNHVFARVSPHRYERQIRVFHDAIGFKRLGVAYEDSEAGRAYTALETIEKVAEEDKFEIVRCHTMSDIPDNQKAIESVLTCIDYLARNSDALYITEQGGVNKQSITNIVEIANKHNIPTFSQLGSEQVKYGILMSMSKPDYKPLGLFLASNLGQVFNGAKPRDLNQLYEEEPNISINLKTAEKIGLYLHAEWLAAADEIYKAIEVPH